MTRQRPHCSCAINPADTSADTFADIPAGISGDCPHLSKMSFTCKKQPFTDEPWFKGNRGSTFTANLKNN